MKALFYVSLFFLSSLGLRGQAFQGSGPAIVGSGYQVPTPITAAPGQLLTLIFEGVSNLTQAVRAPSGADLPLSLTGISLGYNNLGIAEGDSPYMLEVRPFLINGGSAIYPVDRRSLAAITIQMPFSMRTCPACQNGGIPGGFLFADQNGVSGPTFDVNPLGDQVHILTNCDLFLSNTNSGNSYDYESFTGLPCPSLVTHADGSLVTMQKPARAGEEIVAYAVGLGQTNPPLKTGKLVTAAVPAQTTFTLDFNFRPNALATKPVRGGPVPVYAGTTPGYVGLYQINFIVPAVPPGTPPCVVSTPVETSSLRRLKNPHPKPFQKPPFPI